MDVQADKDKCIRCALERGVDPFSVAGHNCVWQRIGRICPDYDKRPDLDSLTPEDIPDDASELIHGQIKLLAERSRFLRADQLVEVSRTMAELFRCLQENRADVPSGKT